MRRITSLLAASTMTIGGLAFMPQARAADPANPANGTVTNTQTQTTDTRTTNANANTANPNGDNPSAKAPDADDIRKTVAKVTEDAFTKDDFHKLTKYFVDADYSASKTSSRATTSPSWMVASTSSGRTGSPSTTKISVSPRIGTPCSMTHLRASHRAKSAKPAPPAERKCPRLSLRM